MTAERFVPTKPGFYRKDGCMHGYIEVIYIFGNKVFGYYHYNDRYLDDPNLPPKFWFTGRNVGHTWEPLNENDIRKKY